MFAGRHIKAIVPIAILVAGVVASVTVRAEEPAEPAQPAAEPAPTGEANAVDVGTGEDLVLVVADTASDPTEALRISGIRNQPFGEMQGFYIDDASSYAINGIHVQVSADALPVTCLEAGGLVRKVLEGLLQEVECLPGQTVVNVLRPIETTYVAKADVNVDVFPSVCDLPTSPPCQLDRYLAVLGDDVAFPPGVQLLVTAFRTLEGAEEFLEFARAAGVRGLVVVNARKLGGGFVGLGQEAHPDGSGPLTGPLPDQASYQR